MPEEIHGNLFDSARSLIVRDATEPGLARRPNARRPSRVRDAQDSAASSMDKPAKIPQLDRVRPVRDPRPSGESGFVDAKSSSAAAFGAATSATSRSTRRPIAAVFVGLLAAGVVDEDPPHGLGRRGEEVAAAVPVLRASRTSTSRRYASCTRAVACSVCPGFSWASFCAASLRSSS